MAKSPVFIVGCPRSGTTLLYHMLLSAGGFAVYLTECKVFDLVFPQAGDLGTLRSRRKALDLWLQSKLFTLSGLERHSIEREILDNCRNGGDFLRAVMDGIAHRQRAERWADNTPEHILYLSTIKKEIPEAQVIHIVRDGRDVALSLAQQGWIQPFACDRKRSFLVSGLYWEWMVEKGQQFGETVGRDYLEVRYEELVMNPEQVLARIGRFIDHNLDYERIQQVALGSVAEPSTSFETESKTGDFSPIGRWQKALAPGDAAALERLIGRTLESLGYPLANISARKRTPLAYGKRAMYRGYWDSKLWLKTSTPLAQVFAKVTPAQL